MKRYLIWGCKECGEKVFNLLDRENEEVVAFVDSDKEKQGKVFCGNIIISPEEAVQKAKNKECDAVISAGSTGAFLAGCTFIVGRIKGIKRPALAPIMPGKNGTFMIVDCGANVDCKPEHLIQFAHMGKEYYKGVMGIENPSVGLVNIGAEAEKGNELTKATYELLEKEDNLNFVGNVEPRYVPDGDTQVLVCDGFVGNTILKMYIFIIT